MGYSAHYARARTHIHTFFDHLTASEMMDSSSVCVRVCCVCVPGEAFPGVGVSDAV